MLREVVLAASWITSDKALNISADWKFSLIPLSMFCISAGIVGALCFSSDLSYELVLS
jgi:hypothetical protein